MDEAETETEDVNTKSDEADVENADEGSKGSRFGSLKKSLGIAVAAVIAVITLRKLRNRGGDEETEA